MRSAFALSWNVQWLGSFPVSGTDPETISRRLDRFSATSEPINVQFSVSLNGVRVCDPQLNVSFFDASNILSFIMLLFSLKLHKLLSLSVEKILFLPPVGDLGFPSISDCISEMWDSEEVTIPSVSVITRIILVFLPTSSLVPHPAPLVSPDSHIASS
ncbi:unnamed protein product [Dracunculus medinensis]|uniref:Uncharacterized protein n=1 Tax=Dracunculus medinensis TaxID=318479 RepID=A0A0N4UD77_DRAME|nr:unnamed protein product [Dracunculus medinensis]